MYIVLEIKHLIFSYSRVFILNEKLSLNQDYTLHIMS